MLSLTVFLSCQDSTYPAYIETTEQLGYAIAAKGIQLIYGGSSKGLMGVLARAVLRDGGHVVGILPRHLQKKEEPQVGLSKLIWVDTIAERMILMHKFADAFMVLPGGLGTMEELFNVWNEIRLGLSIKPLGLLNINDYYTPFLQFIHHMHNHGFVTQDNLQIPIIGKDPVTLLSLICNCN